MREWTCELTIISIDPSKSWIFVLIKKSVDTTEARSSNPIPYLRTVTYSNVPPGGSKARA
jgi:hypothetical protein